MRHVDHENPSLHGHELVELCHDLLIGGRGRYHAPVRHTRVDALQGIDEVGDDILAVVVVGVDGDHFAPAEGGDESADGVDLGRVVYGGSEEVGTPTRCGGESGACG